jgi:hypothetical protein
MDARIRLLHVLLLCAVIPAGCERSAPVPDTAPVPTSRPTSRAAARLPDAVLTVDGLQTEFPHAALRVQQRDGDTFVQLFTPDTPPAARPGDTPNAFSFDLQLEADPQNLDGAEYRFPATERERLNFPTGIFLAGGEVVLQPYSGTIQFTQHGLDVTADINADFLAFPAQESTPSPGTIHVTGQVQVKRKD